MTTHEQQRLTLLTDICVRARKRIDPSVNEGEPPEAHMRALEELAVGYKDSLDKLVKEHESLKTDHKLAIGNLDSVQKRCSELIQESRAQRLSMEMSFVTASQRIREPLKLILVEIAEERGKQDQKWEPISEKLFVIPDGTGGEDYKRAANVAKREEQEARASGNLSWLLVLREEMFEAFAESDPTALRAELVQVAAVAAKWIEIIDRRPKRA